MASSHGTHRHLCLVCFERLLSLRYRRLVVIFVRRVQDLEGVLRQVALAGLLLVILPAKKKHVYIERAVSPPRKNKHRAAVVDTLL